MKRADPAAAVQAYSRPREYWLRAAMKVCACEACCALQPWRREVRKRHKSQLQKLHGKSEEQR